MFWLNWNKQKTHPNTLKESIFGYFSENLGLFRFVTKQFCLFCLFHYRFKTPKQTEIFYIYFHETNRNKYEIDLVSVCFGSNWNLFLFVSRTPYFRVQLPTVRSTTLCPFSTAALAILPRLDPTINFDFISYWFIVYWSRVQIAYFWLVTTGTLSLSQLGF